MLYTSDISGGAESPSRAACTAWAWLVLYALAITGSLFVGSEQRAALLTAAAEHVEQTK